MIRSATSIWNTTRLASCKTILDAAGHAALDVKMNAVNGGSFAVTAVRADDPRRGLKAGHRMAAGAGGTDGA